MGVVGRCQNINFEDFCHSNYVGNEDDADNWGSEKVQEY